MLAGGAYVPLDPSYPQNRLSQIIETARIRLEEVLLGSKEELWLSTEWPNVIKLGISLYETKEKFSLSNQLCFDNQLLYVLFTSGSTGQPKGVPGFESGVLKRLEHWWTIYPHEPDEVTMHHITYNWVDHIMEVWNALLTGRELLLIPDVPSLLNTIETPPYGVRRILLVPSLLREMLRIVDQPKKTTGIFVPGDGFWRATPCNNSCGQTTNLSVCRPCQCVTRPCQGQAHHPAHRISSLRSMQSKPWRPSSSSGRPAGRSSGSSPGLWPTREARRRRSRRQPPRPSAMPVVAAATSALICRRRGCSGSSGKSFCAAANADGRASGRASNGAENVLVRARVEIG